MKRFARSFSELWMSINFECPVENAMLSGSNDKQIFPMKQGVLTNISSYTQSPSSSSSDSQSAVKKLVYSAHMVKKETKPNKD
ncbi:Hypothetical predicted protein [Cloeon dipterum]|uniref:Uncharacterized protein n=1 Tax=Cloeon dipterum TaxID=197152 RepID=A0A8S1DW78_9INSE|nr:Hypothetical predicted protein [Cloeon dipterum]